MPQYQISVPGQGTFRVDSPTELTDLQAWQAVQSQLTAGPSKERTFGEAAKDIAAGVVSGAGSLVQLPGQLYGLATGDFSETGALGLGKDISKYGEEMKSAGLKAREAARAEKIKAAEQTGQWEAFKTAFGETIKDPALLTSFLSEQAPQLLVPFGAAKVAQLGTAAKAAAAAQGLVGEAATKAAGEITKAAAERGARAAIGAGAVQQGADVGAQAYEDIYKELKRKGATDADAAQGALNLARAAGASGALISVLAQRLPGARTLEESFAGVPGTSGRLLGAVKGAAGEGISEVVEETGGKFGANLAMREVKPEQSLLEGLGQTAGMAAIGGVGMGGVSGLARRPAPKPEVAPPVQAPAPVAPTAETTAPETPTAPPVAPPVTEAPPAQPPAPPVAPVAETPAVETPAVPETPAAPPAETPATPVAETPAVPAAPVTEPPSKPDYASMTLEQLEAARQNADATNLQLDVASIKKYMGEEQANAYASMTPRQRDNWWNANATEEMDKESSVFRGVNEETINEYINAFNAFDTESPQSLGRSVALIVKNINNPEFIGSPQYVTLKNALAYAKEKNWSEKEVLDAMRGRAAEWAGNDAVELFKGLFKPAAQQAPATTSLPPPEKPPVTQPKTLEEFRERMPLVFDNSEVRAANNEGNFAKLTKALQRSSNPAIRRIGQLGSGIASKITLKKPGRLGRGVSGRYTYDDDAIQMIPSYAGDEHTNAHETLHALISKAQRYPTERQKPIVQQIDKLYEHVKRELKKKGITVQQAYGLKNAREFTAEAMTNPEFQFELMQIPYPGKKTAWTQFVKLVADLLGIQNTNALTEVMNLVDRLAVQKQPRRKISEKGLAEEMAAPEAKPSVVAKATAVAQKALQKQPMPEKGLGHVSPELTNLAQPIFFPQNKTIIDRIEGMKDRFWQRLAQKTADQFRTIKEYSPTGYMQARLSKSVDGSLEGLLFHGQVFDDGGALNIKTNTKGMMEILKPIGNELDSYLMWVALNRESRLPEEKRSKIPNMDKLVARRAEFAAGELNGKPRVEVYQDVLRQMNQLNKSVLDIALAKGLIDQKGYDTFSNDIYYIPFYKKMDEDGTVEGAKTASGLTSQDFSKELKGSEAPFGDLMENIVRNWSHILSASMKNAAAQTTINDAMKLQAAEPNLKAGLEMRDGVVYSTKSDKPIEAKFDEDGKQLYAEGELRPDLTTSGTGMAKIMVDGQPMYFKVTDELLMDSISSIGYMGPKSKFVLVMRDFKNMLQYGVTASPIFKVNNLIRDSISALAVSDLKKSPVYNVMTGISLSKKDSPTYISALAGGGIFNFGSAYEGDQAKLIKRLLDQGVDGDTILDTKEKITKALKKTWEAYQHLGDRSEAANRLALYQQMRDKGMSHLEASFMARDLLDFSMQGSWPTFRFLTQIVPFMNARIQGLYKLGRDGINPTVRVLYNTTTGKEIDANDKVRAAQFATVSAAVMLASAMLYLSFKDDEDFKKRDAWDRDNFWWFKIPSLDIAFRIPKPFEVGAFGTLVERSLEQIVDQGAEGKQFGKSLWTMLWDTFSLNPTPQLVKPLVDIYANKDSFTGAPIESAGMERLSKQERKTDTTSPLAIALGGLSTLLPEKFEVSPLQMDYAIKGYFGWMGAMASMASTYAVMPFKEGEYPDARWLDRASLGLVRDLPAPQSAYVTAFYENAKEISQAYADMRHYREIGDAEKVQEILEKSGDKIALAKFYDKTSKNIANVRKQIQFITNDKTLDGATKKEEIERMKLIMSDLAKQAEEVRKSMKP